MATTRLLPNAVGYIDNAVPIGEANTWLCVDDVPGAHDGGSTYIRSLDTGFDRIDWDYSYWNLPSLPSWIVDVHY